MASMRDFIKSVGTVLPEIPKPEKKPTLNERFIWTGIALMLYLVMAATPLYGLTGTAAANNASTFLRVVFASAQGTLMTLGIGPIVTAGLILQLLVGSDIIKLDMSDSSDRAIFGSATKLLTLIVIVGESMAYMFGGALGVLTTSQQPVVFIQLVIASVIVLLLDEMIQKGWGLGSGVSLFILAGVCQTVMWYTFSPIPFQVTTGVTQLFGFVPEAISESFNNNLGSVVIRDFKYPSLLTFSLTIVMILVLVYVEGIRIELPITSIKYRGFQGVYPIKLLYVSNIPVILVSALGANVTFFARLLANYSVASPPWWMKYLAVFPASSANGTNTQIPIGGVVFYLTPPQSFQQTLAEPVHSIVYLLYLVGMAVVFARLWVEIGGLNPKAVAKNLMDADVQVPGFRRSGLS
ncbi:MAG: preprotein translocase subunit SecY, partial [Nitrososphaerota archaeon]|nr:preprotein translocase subunit SecY [Nitrososphaerota archaeon]